RQARAVLAALEEKGYVRPADSADDRDALVNDAAMGALAQFDETMRALALQRYHEYEARLGPELTRHVVTRAGHRLAAAGGLSWPEGVEEAQVIDRLTQELALKFGPWLAKNPALEDVMKVASAVAGRLAEDGVLKSEVSEALALKKSPLRTALAE